jgi:uncharacterized protein DUF3352
VQPTAEKAPARRPPPILRWFVRERHKPPPPPTAPPKQTLPPAPPSEPATPKAEPEPEAEKGGSGGASAAAALGGAAARVGRVPVAAGRGVRRFWLSMSVYTRRRLVLALGVLGALLVIAFVAVPALPCQFPGGDVCPPSDDAIALVPDDALAYAHVNVNPDTEQYQKARDVAARVPTLAAQAIDRLLLARIPGPNGSQPDFQKDIAPWFGGQAALAVVPAGGQAAEEVQLLQVKDEAAAKQYADSVAAGTPKTSNYRNVPVSVDRRGLATAIVGGFLAIGRDSGVRAVIDAQSGAQGTGSLADDPKATAARDALPAERLADAYLSPDGIAQLVGNPRGPLATLDAAVDPTASDGVAMALVADDQGINVDIRSELNEARAKAQPGFFAAFPAFEPKLTGSLPAGSLAYAGIADPGHALVSLLAQASANQPGLAAGVAALLQRVKQLGKVDLETELLPSLGDEAAFALQPATSGSGIPFLEFLSSGIDSQRAGRALASLQGPIADALNASSGQTPNFSETKVNGVTAHSMQVSPTVNLTYAIADTVLLIATDPAAVKQLSTGGPALADDPTFKEATADLPSSVSLLAYLNLSGLITLGEQAGLAQDPAYQTFAPEIRKLQALGLAVQESPTQLATDVRLIVGSETSAAASTGDQPTPKD